MFYVYALFDNISNRFYIGYTRNIKRRFREHKTGKSHTTARYKRVHLVFYEAFFNEEDARRRERYFKTTQGRKGLRLILRETLSRDNKDFLSDTLGS